MNLFGLSWDKNEFKSMASIIIMKNNIYAHSIIIVLRLFACENGLNGVS